jgi:hypothetical protein
MQVPFGFFYVIYAMILDLWRLMMVFNVNNAGFPEGNAWLIWWHCWFWPNSSSFLCERWCIFTSWCRFSVHLMQVPFGSFYVMITTRESNIASPKWKVIVCWTPLCCSCYYELLIFQRPCSVSGKPRKINSKLGIPAIVKHGLVAHTS